MKILELRLTAFGPFTERILDLSAGNHGLHVIFGPNEAGKSSALRALHALLYGISAQTADAFLHPYAKLRIGARLRLSSGEEIDFSRRKAIKGSLLGPGDVRLDDDAIDRFLGGVRAEQFRMFWGIDYPRLLQGGREVLEGHGDLGETLFAAGSGASQLGTLRKKLDEEAAALFAPRGQKPPVNQGVLRLRELRAAQREATVSPDEWARQDRAANDADAEVTQLTRRMQDRSKEKSRLERLKRVLPLLAERNDIRSHLADLGVVVPLASDFPRRRQEAETEFRTATLGLERVLRELREQEDLVTELGPTPALVAEADEVNNLHKGLGGYRKALSDRPRLVGQRIEQRSLATRLLGEFRPDLDIEVAESLRLYIGRRARIQKLAAERERLDERQELARQRQIDAQEQVAVLAREASTVSSARNVDRLVGAIEEARRRGDVDTEREKLAQAARKDAAQRDAAIHKLTLPSASIDRLLELPVPTVAAITRFERNAQELEDEGRAARSERQRLSKATRDLESKIEALRTKKAVPTETDLVELRACRDQAFGLLREHWEKGRDIVAEAHELLGEGDLLDLYPPAVVRADEVADRLRSEADRVAELAQYLEERERLAEDTEEADTSAAQREKAVEQLRSAWSDAWRPVLPTPPQLHDGRAWHDDFVRLLERSEAAVEARQRLDEWDRWVEERIRGLRAAMTAMEPTTHPEGGLSMTLAAAARLRQRIEKEERVRAEHERKTLESEQEIHDAEAAVLAAKTDVDNWKGRWDEAALGLVQGDAPPPDDALVALDRIESILRALAEASGYDGRIAGIDRDAESFRAEVRALGEHLGDREAIENGSEDVWVETLHKRLGVMLQVDERRRQARERLSDLREEEDEEEEAVKAASLTLAALREEARCGADGDLLVVEKRSADLGALQSDLTRVEKELIRGGDGASIVDLESEATGADKDSIDDRLVQIGSEMTELDTKLSEARDLRAGALAELRRLRGPSAASEKAEEAQATLARLRDDVIRYSRLRVASTLLGRRIDDYRKKNQAPLLLRAGELFSEMTLRSFERLEADMEDETPILVGVRPDGTRVPSHGMSEGSRDQLFFALRLAAVEASCSAGEPMPFVVDDVLVQFDDERGAAALRALADVALRTQVVLFTHHQHVRSCARGITASATVIVHEL